MRSRVNKKFFLVNVLSAGRMGLNRSIALRHLRNRLRFPGLALDPSVNCSIEGRFEYGAESGISEGCNLLVPRSATLRLGSGCYIGRYVELGPLGSIEIGDSTSVQDRSILVGDVSLGRYCVLSLNVLMTSGTHYYDRWPQLLIRDQDQMVAEDVALSARHSRPILVGEDCWFGMNSVVMPGVSVGRGCVVGTNAVVTRDLSPYSVAVGAPARVIKQRFVFKPPSRIDWQTLEDIPYFYTGFELARNERARNLVLGGHVARSHFSLWLGTAGDKLGLRVRAATDGSVTLEYSGVRTTVGNDWTTCVFPGPDADKPALFRVDGEAGAIVSGAWVQ